jgi:4a-hydroxytetrahydrobiopterin dehydratase
VSTLPDLARRKFKPPRKGTAPLKGDELHAIHKLLEGDWQMIDEHHLEKTFQFENFQQALDFTNAVGELAESVDHHPEICLTWGKAKITIWTHSIGGLSDADFIFAARCEELA